MPVSAGTSKSAAEPTEASCAKSSFRIAAIESERDKARELHEQKIQQYEEEADRLKQLCDSTMGVIDSISDDIFEIEKSMGKVGTSPLELVDKERENYAAAAIARRRWRNW